MNVSLAQVIVAHIVVFGARQDKNETFANAAKAITEAKPKSWKRLMRIADEVLAQNAGADYEKIAEIVKAKYLTK